MVVVREPSGCDWIPQRRTGLIEQPRHPGVERDAVAPRSDATVALERGHASPNLQQNLLQQIVRVLTRVGTSNCRQSATATQQQVVEDGLLFCLVHEGTQITSVSAV